MLILAFDTETTGLARWKDNPGHPAQPDIIQIAAILSDSERIYAEFKALVNPADVHPEWDMGVEAAAVHGVTREQVELAGIPTQAMNRVMMGLIDRADHVVCHNVDFDKKMFQIALTRSGTLALPALDRFTNKPTYCTMKRATNLCKLPSEKGGYKWPRLSELYQHLFGEGFEGAHDAMNDIRATVRCYWELRRMGL